jgi:hypothetical protein
MRDAQERSTSKMQETLASDEIHFSSTHDVGSYRDAVVGEQNNTIRNLHLYLHFA